MEPGILKLFILAMLAAIVTSLFLAARSLVQKREDRDPKATVKALTVRISLSISLLILIVIFVATGLIPA